MDYIKSNMTKHTSDNFFYPYELQTEGEVKILQVSSCDNLDNLYKIGHLRDLQGSGR